MLTREEWIKMTNIAIQTRYEYDTDGYKAQFGKGINAEIVEKLKAENNPHFEKYIYGYSHEEAMKLAERYGLLSAEELIEDFGEEDEDAEILAQEIKTYLSF